MSGQNHHHSRRKKEKKTKHNKTVYVCFCSCSFLIVSFPFVFVSSNVCCFSLFFFVFYVVSFLFLFLFLPLRAVCFLGWELAVLQAACAGAGCSWRWCAWVGCVWAGSSRVLHVDRPTVVPKGPSPPQAPSRPSFSHTPREATKNNPIADVLSQTYLHTHAHTLAVVILAQEQRSSTLFPAVCFLIAFRNQRVVTVRQNQGGPEADDDICQHLRIGSGGYVSAYPSL